MTTEHVLSRFVWAALRTGALGYVIKTDARRELVLAVDAVLRGKQFVSNNVEGYEFSDAQREKTLHCHEVHFYSNDEVFLDSFARFIAVAIKAGDAAIVVATESHLNGLVPRLKIQGVDVDAAMQQGTYVQLDVDKTLSTFMVNTPDPARFFEAVGGLIEAAAKTAKREHPRVVACGECAPLLWAAGKTDAAIRIERLWDEVGKIYEMDILCGYALNSFHGIENVPEAFFRSRLHTGIMPGASSSVNTEQRRSRKTIFLIRSRSSVPRKTPKVGCRIG